MRVHEFIGENADTIKLQSRDDGGAQVWINKVYSKYPYTFNRNHVMAWGEGDDQELAMFELVPSMSKRGAVEVKWFQAYPLRQGIGSRAMRELQALAKEDGITLTLFPWDKGQVSQAKLMKFYRSVGFNPITKGSKSLYWEPGREQNVTEAFDHPYKLKWEKGEFGDYDALAMLDDGTNLSIMFNKEDDDSWMVEFWRGASQSMTGEGDAQRIFATVLTAIQQFIKKKHPTLIFFSASKLDPTANRDPEEPRANPASRAKLYTRLVQRYAAAWGYSINIRDEGSIVRYRLERLTENVAESSDDKALAFKAHLIKTMPQIMKLFANVGKGWSPSKEQLLAAVDTGYQVMKHTGDAKQAGKAVMDELNTLHRMSQGEQGVSEARKRGKKRKSKFGRSITTGWWGGLGNDSGEGGGEGVAEDTTITPKIGINVRSDGDIDYAALIVDGKKKFESRKSDSLRAYVGKTVGVVRTGKGAATAIGQVTIGEPIVVDAEKFDKLRNQHLVPKHSKFDIEPNSVKYLYPLTNPVRWTKAKLIKNKGIVARQIQEQNGANQIKTVTRIDSSVIPDFATNLRSYKHTADWSQSGLATDDDSYWKKQNIKPLTTKGVFAGEPHRTALYATGNAHETRYVEYTENGQPVVYFDKRDLPAIRNRKTHLTVFDASNFKQLPTGEYFSDNPGTPLKQTPINDPFKYIASQGWIVRITDNLDKVFKQVQKMHQAGKIQRYGAEGMNESKQPVAESINSIPPVLYHATYRPLLRSIKQNGLGGQGSERKRWTDSARGVVYLATTPEVAESYAETSDEVPEDWLDAIVVLKVRTANLDSSKLHLDRNVQDNTGDTLEYHGVIPASEIFR